jgi:hypothetical protein
LVGTPYSSRTTEEDDDGDEDDDAVERVNGLLPLLFSLPKSNVSDEEENGSEKLPYSDIITEFASLSLSILLPARGVFRNKMRPFFFSFSLVVFLFFFGLLLRFVAINERTMLVAVSTIRGLQRIPYFLLSLSFLVSTFY